MPKMIQGSHKEPQHPYGYCKICQSSVEIPGLTDSKCPKHGWISTAFSVTSQIQEQAAKTYQQKQPAVLPEEKSSRSNSSYSTSIKPPHSKGQPRHKLPLQQNLLNQSIKTLRRNLLSLIYGEV